MGSLFLRCALRHVTQRCGLLSCNIRTLAKLPVLWLAKSILVWVLTRDFLCRQNNLSSYRLHRPWINLQFIRQDRLRVRRQINYWVDWFCFIHWDSSWQPCLGSSLRHIWKKALLMSRKRPVSCFLWDLAKLTNYRGNSSFFFHGRNCNFLGLCSTVLLPLWDGTQREEKHVLRDNSYPGKGLAPFIHWYA